MRLLLDACTGGIDRHDHAMRPRARAERCAGVVYHSERNFQHMTEGVTA